MSECTSPELGSGHSQEQAGSVTARDDDQGEHFFCLSQLLVTLVAESCIFTPPPNTRAHAHAILGYALGSRQCSYGEGFNEGSRWADDRGKCTLCEGEASSHYCHTCFSLELQLEQLRYDPSNHFTACQNPTLAYYFRYFRDTDVKMDMFVLL